MLGVEETATDAPRSSNLDSEYQDIDLTEQPLEVSPPLQANLGHPTVNCTARRVMTPCP